MQKYTAFAKGAFCALQKAFSKCNLLFIMRLSTVCIAFIAFSFQLLAAEKGMGQNIREVKVVLGANGQSLRSVLQALQAETGFNFFYSSDAVKQFANVELDKSSRTIAETLDAVLAKTGLSYRQNGNNIIIFSVGKVTAVVADRTLFGFVTDDQDQPLPGVTVKSKNGKFASTLTDVNGHFEVKIGDETDAIVLSFVGYETREFPVKQVTQLRASLKPSTGSLNEVVVIGYGTAKRKELTGAVSSITAEDISKQAVQNPLTAMMGRVAGASVTQINGYGSSRVQVNVRGAGSLSLGGGNTPLFVVDGVPFNINDAATYSNLNTYGIQPASGYQSPFAMLNPADIERIDVLKDADATAIYGSRAANGVVLITTKKGQTGATKLSLNLTQGVGKVAHFIDMMNTQQYLEMRREAFKNDGLTPTAASNPDLFAWDQNAYTDWQRLYLGGSAKYTDLQGNLTGGNNTTRFLLGTSYHRETTVLPGSNQDQRFTTRLNLDHSSVDKRFTMNLNASYAYDLSTLNSTDISLFYYMPPNMPIYNTDGSLYWDPTQVFTNPEAWLRRAYLGKTNNLLSNLNLKYTLSKGLDLKTNIGYTSINLNQRLWYPANSYNPLTSPTNNASFATVGQSALNIEPQLTYEGQISKGKLSLLAGATILRSLNQSQYLSATNYPNVGLMETPLGAASYSILSSTMVLYKYFSVFGRATYNWDGKYVINGTFRRDGSSKFGADRRFGNFGSIGGAWIFTKEDWLANNKILSFGKLRASYGITGNDQFADYNYNARYNSASASLAYQGNATVAPSFLRNPDLHWETNKKLDLGIELGFLADRIRFNTSYYRSRSDNQANNVALSAPAGLSSYFGNIPALVQSRGFEFELNTTNINGKSFQWKTSFNLTLANSKILAVDPSYFYYSTTVLGYPIDQQLKYNFLYINPQTGVPVYQSKTTANGETNTPASATDRVLPLSSLPTSYGGLSNDFSYKNLALSFTLQFSRQSGSIKPANPPGIYQGGNLPVYMLDRWRNPGDVTDVPKVTTATSAYSAYYNLSNAVWGDNSFLRLQNVNLSYTIPQTASKHLHMSNLRVFMQGQNVLTWAKNKNVYDPMTGVSYPPLRVITLGLNCTF